MIHEEMVTLVELTLQEAVIIQKVRELQFGSISVNKHSGLIKSIDSRDSTFITDQEALTAAEKIGQKIYTKPVIDRDGVSLNNGTRQNPSI